MNNKLPTRLLKILRKRFDLDEDDSSIDDELNALEPIVKLRHIVAWDLGNPDWADQILYWAKICGIKIGD